MSLLTSVERIDVRAPKATAALIFLHGAGETGQDAKNTFLKHLGGRGHQYIKVYFPTAKRRYMKIRDKVTTFWFEAERTGQENIDIDGKIEDANEVVDMLENMVKEIEATGIHRSRIAIGGTSQGGIVSIYGVYSKGIKVGAVVTASSTVLFRKDAKYSSTSRIPLLSLYGKDDSIITEESINIIWKFLRDHKINFTPRTLLGCGHAMNEEYVKFMMDWLEMKIPLSDA